MHHLVIGEGQTGRAIIERAAADGDDVTVLRRTPVEPSGHIARVTGDVLDPAVLSEAMARADAVHACFHAAYDARIWARDLPPRELAVLDAAASHGIPVIFPESMYGFLATATDLVEGAALSPLDAKGRVRASLLTQRRQHAARTLSIVASDFIGPTVLGTGSAVACTLVIEPILNHKRPFIVGSPSAPHALTFIPDLAVAMVHAARHAERLTSSRGGDAVLHAPTAPARSSAELVAATEEISGTSAPSPLKVPRFALKALARVSTLARELAGIAPLWYEPCVLRPGVLTTEEGLEPTSWEDAIRATVDHARGTASQTPTSALQ